MTGPDELAIARQRLADELSKARCPPSTPLEISPWLAMSLLQKAIRRGEDEIAQRAAATLLNLAPDKFWRRCGVIAFEDVGLADTDTGSLVVAALGGKRFRGQCGGEWAVASSIVSKLARAPKCRAADDLLLAAEFNPQYETARRQFAALTIEELLQITTGSRPLPECAIALWYAIGTGWRRSRFMNARRGDPQIVFDHLKKEGIPHAVVDTAREGYRKTGEVLCAFVPLLWRVRSPGPMQDDEFPPEVLVRGVPGWAFDIYSREGRRALQTFLEGGSATASWVRARIPPARRIAFLGGILFRIEGGQVRRRLDWPTGQGLRREADLQCQGVPPAEAANVLELMRGDIGLLNQVRADVC